MLLTLFPNTYTRYTALLCSWLEAQGYPPNAICRRVEAAPFLDAYLRQGGILSLASTTAERLRACLPREKRWTPQIAYTLGRSLLQHLHERGKLAVHLQPHRHD